MSSPTWISIQYGGTFGPSVDGNGISVSIRTDSPDIRTMLFDSAAELPPIGARFTTRHD